MHPQLAGSVDVVVNVRTGKNSRHERSPLLFMSLPDPALKVNGNNPPEYGDSVQCYLMKYRFIPN